MKATTEHPVHELIARRWSPYSFSNEAVDSATLCSLFEAARWAPSSYNEQPWAYIVGTRDDQAAFDRVLECLVPGNRVWAAAAPVLALGLSRGTFSRNGKSNRHAFHDLGLASENLVLEATSRGLVVHQMAGIDPDAARRLFNVPAEWEIVTGIAIGRAGRPEDLPEALKGRDVARSTRKPIREFVYGGAFGTAAVFVK